MAIAGGIPCDVDPLLYNVMKTHCGKVMMINQRVGQDMCNSEHARTAIKWHPTFSLATEYDEMPDISAWRFDKTITTLTCVV